MRILWWICGGGLALATSAAALAEIAGVAPLPEALEVLVARLPILFPLHMLAGALALALLPLVFALRRRRPWHRFLGRTALVLSCLSALAALPSALLSTAGPVVRAGLFAQGCTWLLLCVAAYAAIRLGHVGLHRSLTLAMAAVASGAVALRILLQLAVGLELDFERSYAVIAWASWLAPLVLVAFFMRPNLALRRPSGADIVAAGSRSGDSRNPGNGAS